MSPSGLFFESQQYKSFVFQIYFLYFLICTNLLRPIRCGWRMRVVAEPEETTL